MGIDPLQHQCRCGYRFHINIFQKLRMLLFGDYLWICPVCHRRIWFRLLYHIVKVESKEMNKEVWKKC